MIKSKLILLITLLGLLAACQQSVVTGPAVQKTAPPRVALEPNDALLIQGAPGERAAIYDRLDQSLVWHLPPGRESVDGRAYVAAVARGDKTQLRHYVAHLSQPQAVYDVDGSVEISAISANGRWVVFTRDNPASAALSEKVKSTIQVLDLKREAFSEVITLDGNFLVEGIDNVGRSIYLIEHLPEQGDGNHYRVRVFDAQKYRLDLTPIRDKRFLDEIMAGYAWGTATDPKGRWLTTLYVNSLNDTAFIHALNLGDRWALCLPLPSATKDRELLKYYGLALTPEGDAVVAVNPLLGTLVEINLKDTAQQKIRRFDPITVSPTAALTPESLFATTVSAAGQTLYFAFEQNVWRYDRQTGHIAGPYSTADPILDLALTGDEETLLLASNTSTLFEASVDLAFGQLAAK